MNLLSLEQMFERISAAKQTAMILQILKRFENPDEKIIIRIESGGQVMDPVEINIVGHWGSQFIDMMSHYMAGYKLAIQAEFWPRFEAQESWNGECYKEEEGQEGAEKTV